jgi:hypothetical protein
MSTSTKNTTPLWHPPKPNSEGIFSNPFGSVLSSVSKGVYRYGMNTQEKENEIYGEGNSYTAEYWQYDARLGRRWNVDPRDVPSFSPYSCFANNPLWFSDVAGDSALNNSSKITEAATNAVKSVIASDNGETTPAKCNIGVKCAFNEITGSKELNGMKANEMHDFMHSSKNFETIDVANAQEAANNGEVVIASYKSLSGSGHVALVVPGKAATLGTWNGKPASSIGGIPLVMDTGAGKREESQSVNYSFGKSIQGEVVFYKYKPQITNTNSNDVAITTNNIQPLSPSIVSPNLNGLGNITLPTQTTLSAAPNPTFGQGLQQSKIPIFQTVGDILNYFSF